MTTQEIQDMETAAAAFWASVAASEPKTAPRKRRKAVSADVCRCGKVGCDCEGGR